jgi:hypothetical protein
MKSRPNDAETIRRQMARIRHKHHEDIGEVLAGAEKVAGWGRHIRLYSCVAVGAAAVIWVITNRVRTVPMKRANPEIVAKDAEEFEETLGTLAQPSTTRPGLLGGAARFLTTVVVRAAQNYAAHCLEEWISARRVPGTTKTRPLPPSDDSSIPDGRLRRPEQVNGNCEKLRSVLLVGGSKND